MKYSRWFINKQVKDVITQFAIAFSIEIFLMGLAPFGLQQQPWLEKYFNGITKGVRTVVYVALVGK